MSKVFLVIGYNRSGTSLVAGLLHKMGVNMGKRLKGASSANEKGFFENLEFVKLNIRILEDNGFDINAYPNPKQSDVAKLKSQYKKEIKELVSRNKDKLWGWKDPRTFFTFPLYEPFLENIHFIVVYRNPISAVQSMIYRDNAWGANKDFEYCLRIYHDYYQKIGEFFAKNEKYPRTYVAYERFFENNEQVKELCNFVGIKYKSVEEHIDPKLKHF